MTVTAWERRKALSDQLRGVWDAHRDGVLTWEHAFLRAKTAMVVRMTSDADQIASMTWDEFKRLQGWVSEEPPNVLLSERR